MGNRKKVIHLYNEQTETYDTYKEGKTLNYGFLFFIIMTLILTGAVCQFAIFSGAFFDEQMSPTLGMVVWILIGAGIIASIIMMAWVRKRSMDFAKWLGYNEEEFATMKDWEKHLGKIYTDDEYEAKFEEFKKWKKEQKNE